MTKEEFLKEYESLKKRFPRPPQSEGGNKDCEYGNFIYDSNNTYYGFDSAQLDDCKYVYDVYKEKNDYDCAFVAFSENCCELLDSAECGNCYGSKFLARSYNLINCEWCVDSHDCFGCTHLANKSYCIYNIQHTEEEYQQKIPELLKTPREEIKKRIKDIQKNFPILHSDHNENHNSDYCDYAYRCKDSYYCFDSTDLDSCGYDIASHRCKDVWDSVYAIECEQSAEIIGAGKCYNCYNAQDSDRCYDSFYIYRCKDCNDCFGCVELANSKYCILNKQYTKDEYEKIVIGLKGELGFPV